VFGLTSKGLAVAQIISLLGAKRDRPFPQDAGGRPSELVIFPGVDVGMLQAVVRENKAKKAQTPPRDSN
jgi:hypothetical protein